MTDRKRLITLFRAFRTGDDTAFLAAAEAIIDEEAAGNGHSEAVALRQALGDLQRSRRSGAQQQLRMLPKDRKSGHELLNVRHAFVDESHILLQKEVEPKVGRFLLEHRHSGKLARAGYRPKTKLLFWGPPGCGKTFCAEFIAHELGLPFAVVRLHALISSYLGDTASNLQSVFSMAQEQKMVLLLDEVDAVAKQRDDRNDVGELKRVVNSLLQAIDSFTGDSIIIAATNHQYMLDEAVWRRFDDVVHFMLPSAQERRAYLRKQLNGVRLQGSLDAAVKATEGLSFDDLRRASTEAVKTMLLADSRSLSVDELSREVLSIKRARPTTKRAAR
jgi:SpoVK/Ycf46/Vps4 family AAA+-type ATPase